MKNKLCCILDPLRGCRTCGWQICAYCYMTTPLPQSVFYRNVTNVHNAVIKGHNPDITSDREMTAAEVRIAQNQVDK